MYNPTNATNYRDFLMSSTFGAFLVAGIIMLLILFVVLYIYTSFAWYKIGKRMKYRHSWLAWIPVANIAMFLQLGQFNWAWVFLALAPILGWIPLLVLVTISLRRIFEKNNQSGWLALALPFVFVPVLNWVAWIVYLVTIGIIAWGKNKKR